MYVGLYVAGGRFMGYGSSLWLCSVLITTMARRLLTPDVVADSCARLSWCHHTASKAATTALLLTTMFFGVSVFSSFIAVVNQTVQKLVIKADYLIITTREGGGGDDEDEDEVSEKRKERAYSLAWCYLALERKSWSRGVAQKKVAKVLYLCWWSCGWPLRYDEWCHIGWWSRSHPDGKNVYSRSKR